MSSPLLLYSLSDRRTEDALLSLCRSLRLSCRKLRPTDGSSLLGMLAEPAGAAPSRNNAGSMFPGSAPLGLTAAASPSLPDLLVFCRFGDSLLDLFLAEYKKAGLRPVALKAVLTPTNAGWTPLRLAAELELERKAITKNLPSKGSAS